MTDTAAQLVASAKAVLLDFDGPVTPLMPPPRNAQAADTARQPLLRAHIDLPRAIAETTDHLAVLRYAASLGPDILEAVEYACIGAEVTAAEVSQPTPGAHDFLRACKRDDKPVVIVSNNSADAVHIHLGRFKSNGLVRGVVGRAMCHPELMKPHPSLVFAALELVQAPPTSAVLIGDSVTDIKVSHAAGLAAIGYGKNNERSLQLKEAGADAIVESFADLVGGEAGPQ